jgi:hypothetical protein
MNVIIVIHRTSNCIYPTQIDDFSVSKASSFISVKLEIPKRLGTGWLKEAYLLLEGMTGTVV